MWFTERREEVGERKEQCRKANAFPDTIDPLSISLIFSVGRTPGAVFHVKRDAIK